MIAEWMRGGLRGLPDGLWSEARVGKFVKPKGAVGFERDLIVGPPFGKRATLETFCDGRYWSGSYSESRLDASMATVASAPGRVKVAIEQLDHLGRRGQQSSFAVIADWTEPAGWVSLFLRPTIFGVQDGWVEEWVVEGLRQYALKFGVAFAAITPTPGEVTGIEYGQRGYPIKRIQWSETVLRGYEWVTVLSTAIANRLGGVESLAQSGAFFAVESLSSETVWLQATRRFAEYDEAAVERVFEALRPALPDRELAAPLFHPSPWVLYSSRGSVEDPTL